MVAIKLQKEENRQAFLKVFPTLAEEVLAELRKYNMPEDAYEWTKKVKNKNKKTCHHHLTYYFVHGRCCITMSPVVMTDTFFIFTKSDPRCLTFTISR